MFLFQEIYYATPGLQDLVDSRVRSLHENHSLSPEFVATDWMKFTGDETTYLALRLWTQNEATYSAEQREWMAEYNRTRPADIFTRPPDIEYFDQVKQSGTSGAAGFLVYADLLIGGHTPAMSLEDELHSELKSAGGFLEYRLYESLGRSSHFFRAEFWRSRADAIGFWRHEDRRDYIGRVKEASNRGMPDQRHYDVLHQLGDTSGRTA